MFGEIIRQRILEMGISAATVRDMAPALSWREAYLAISGQLDPRRIDFARAAQLADALDIDAQDLLNAVVRRTGR